MLTPKAALAKDRVERSSEASHSGRRSSKQSTEIWSIFNQIERVASEIMIERGKAIKIPIEDFPVGAPLVNDVGTRASFGLIIKRKDVPEFNALCAELRA